MQSSRVQSNPGAGTQSRAMARARCSATRVHERASKEEAANSSAQGEMRTAHNADLESRCGRNAQRAWQSRGANGVEAARTVAAGRADEKWGVWDGEWARTSSRWCGGASNAMLVLCGEAANGAQMAHWCRALRSISGCTAGGKLGAQDEGDEGETGDGKGMLRWWKTMDAACAMGERLRSALWDAQGGSRMAAGSATYAGLPMRERRGRRAVGSDGDDRGAPAPMAVQGGEDEQKSVGVCGEATAAVATGNEECAGEGAVDAPKRAHRVVTVGVGAKVPPRADKGGGRDEGSPPLRSWQKTGFRNEADPSEEPEMTDERERVFGSKGQGDGEGDVKRGEEVGWLHGRGKGRRQIRDIEG
ncbi:hypothetical protein B0H13DRAFT_2277431 [Mycena leptocephala]|nr:hypothetical protein B0H13DRAFT_2277431 [Mycena leptocephala]